MYNKYIRMDYQLIIVAAITMLLLDFVYLSSLSKVYSETVASIQRTAMNVREQLQGLFGHRGYLRSQAHLMQAIY